jgi:hypothetical protein
VGDAADNLTCSVGTVCCEPHETDAGVYPPSKCVAPSLCGSGVGTSIGCLEATDCGDDDGGRYCCLLGTPEQQAGCNYDYVLKFGTTCSSSPCTTYTVCEMNSECPADAGVCGFAESAGVMFGICQSGSGAGR